MDPETGTFLSVDPVVPQYDDPQSLNAYAYARNNPMSYNDPTGGNWLQPEIPWKIDEMIVKGTPQWDSSGPGGIPWTAYQDGTFMDALGSKFIAGEAHKVRAKLEGIGAGIGPGAREPLSSTPSPDTAVTDEIVVRGDRGVQVAEKVQCFDFGCSGQLAGGIGPQGYWLLGLYLAQRYGPRPALAAFRQLSRVQQRLFQELSRQINRKGVTEASNLEIPRGLERTTIERGLEVARETVRAGADSPAGVQAERVRVLTDLLRGP